MSALDSSTPSRATPAKPALAHPALQSVYHRVGSSTSAFDQACCQTQQWTSKYAPTCAENCLQEGQEAIVLRDWLRCLGFSTEGVDHTESGDDLAGEGTRRLSTQLHPRKKRTKNRRLEDDMSGFVVADDDDDSDDDSGGKDQYEFMDLDKHSGLPSRARSLVRKGSFTPPGRTSTKRTMNGILLSGPCGSGKSAAVYAAAKELGFEVFEINSGSRRSGKDLLERVGDMSINHLVQRSKGDALDSAHGKADGAQPADRDQSSMTDFMPKAIGAFFVRGDAQEQARRAAKPSLGPDSNGDASLPHGITERSERKNSLILLEEVDIIFEEDRHFWSTVSTLLLQSRRPVVMTCNDEGLVPVDSLSLQAILRFHEPPVSLAADYLQLVAAAEGHLLRRDAVEVLYLSKRRDLRASMTELDFWCQMAIGDRKSGLDWMDHDLRHLDKQLGGSNPPRVVSQDSYLAGMGWSSGDTIVDVTGDGNALEESLVADLWSNWGIDAEDWCGFLVPRGSDGDPMASTIESRPERLAANVAMDRFHEGLSSADVFACQGGRGYEQTHLDAGQPALSDKERLDTVQGYWLLDTPSAVSCCQECSTQMALRSALSSKRALQVAATRHDISILRTRTPTEEDFIGLVVDRRSRPIYYTSIAPSSSLKTALDPIFERSGGSAGLSSSSSSSLSSTLRASDLDRPLQIVVEDLAPYVRAIVRSDVHLAEQKRRRLEQQLLAHAEDRRGPPGKQARMRTTRASRSAVEGGDRSAMRRDRWFDVDLDVDLVLRTAPASWHEAITTSDSSGGFL